MLDKNATARVLDNYKSLGYDLDRGMRINFFIEGNKTCLDKVSHELLEIDNKFDTAVEYEESFDIWTCYCSIDLIPGLDEVWRIEQLLNNVANKYACNYLGFGSFGNVG